MQQVSAQIAGLRCVSVDVLPAGVPPDLVAVFCHGFGAPATDLVPLGQELLDLVSSAAPRLRIIFPAAPLDLAGSGIPGGRAWWPLDILRLQQDIESGAIRNRRNESPPELPQARTLLTGLVKELQATLKLPLSRFVLGGFSQGAMLATDVALRLPQPVGGLVIYSGTLISESQWSELASGRAGLPVIQSHGTIDPILPFEAAEWLRDLLTSRGLSVEFLPFRGPHTIPFAALEATARLLQQVGSTPLTGPRSGENR